MISAAQWEEFDRWPKGLTIDPADRKPWFMLWWMVNPRHEIVFIEEWPETPFYQTPGKRSIDEYCEIITRVEKGDNRLARPIVNKVWPIMDPNYGRSPIGKSGVTLADELSSRGFYFDTSVNDDIWDRHLLVTSRLNMETIFFLPHLTNTIEAMERYIHREYRNSPLAKDERGREEYKDGADCVGYTVVSDPQFFVGGGGPSFEMTPLGL